MGPGYVFPFRLGGVRGVITGMEGAGIQESREDQKKEETLKMDQRTPLRLQGHRRWVAGRVTAG